MQQIVGVLQANNLTLPGGQVSTDAAQIPVSTIGRFDSTEAIEQLVVGVRPTPVVPAGRARVARPTAGGPVGRTSAEPARGARAASGDHR